MILKIAVSMFLKKILPGRESNSRDCQALSLPGVPRRANCWFSEESLLHELRLVNPAWARSTGSWSCFRSPGDARYFSLQACYPIKKHHPLRLAQVPELHRQQKSSPFPGTV